MKAKHFCAITLGCLLLFLIVYAIPIIVIDPHLHYHVPLDGLEYPIGRGRYQNSGILKHFTYDAIITGTSMTENFKTSEWDSMFGTTSVKVPFSGGTYKEVNEHVLIGLTKNPEVRYVVRSLDYSEFLRDKDAKRYENTPDYLSDSNPFNDVQYIWNKEVFDEAMKVLEFTENGNKTPTFDEYTSWDKKVVYGKEAVLSSFEKLPEKNEKTVQQVSLTEEEREIIMGNVRQNVAETAENYPDTEFYLFFTPYSIAWWGSQERQGKLFWQIEAERMIIEELLQYDNIRLFSFSNDFELTCNLDNYKDQAHYSGAVNSEIFRRMYAGEYQLTKDNYEKYLEELLVFYGNYDYDALYQ